MVWLGPRVPDTLIINNNNCVLVSESLSAVPCPFEGSFYFDYKDDMSGFCEAAHSYAQRCAGGKQYLLNFTHCSPWTQFDAQGEYSFHYVDTSDVCLDLDSNPDSRLNCSKPIESFVTCQQYYRTKKRK